MLQTQLLGGCSLGCHGILGILRGLNQLRLQVTFTLLCLLLVLLKLQSLLLQLHLERVCSPFVAAGRCFRSTQALVLLGTFLCAFLPESGDLTCRIGILCGGCIRDDRAPFRRQPQLFVSFLRSDSNMLLRHIHGYDCFNNTFACTSDVHVHTCICSWSWSTSCRRSCWSLKALTCAAAVRSIASSSSK
jgi:hypothetical protein